jgi:hypothetical protein
MQLPPKRPDRLWHHSAPIQLVQGNQTAGPERLRLISIEDVEAGQHNYNTNFLATHQNAFASHVATVRPYPWSPEHRFAHVHSLRAQDVVLKRRNVCTFPFLLGESYSATLE